MRFPACNKECLPVRSGIGGLIIAMAVARRKPEP